MVSAGAFEVGQLPPKVDDLGASSVVCFACGNAAGNRNLRVPGEASQQEKFVYSECANCRSLAIATIPDDLSAYYAGNYYSFSTPTRGRLRGWAKAKRDRYCMTGSGLMGAAFAKVSRSLAHEDMRPIMDGSLTGTAVSDPLILDVGCGAGAWLHSLAACGLTRLTGIDPFLPSERTTGSPLLFRHGISDVTSMFDVIRANHSLEHMPDPASALEHIGKQLNPGGVALISIPLADSAIWRTFGGDWVQLDAPRHLRLFSVKGFFALCAKLNLKVIRVLFDSDEFSVLGSEFRQRGVGPHEDGAAVLWASVTQRDRRRAREIVHRANVTETADQANFFLQPQG